MIQIINSVENPGQILRGKFRFVDGAAEEVIERRGKWARRVEERTNPQSSTVVLCNLPSAEHRSPNRRDRVSHGEIERRTFYFPA